MNKTLHANVFNGTVFVYDVICSEMWANTKNVTTQRTKGKILAENVIVRAHLKRDYLKEEQSIHIYPTPPLGQDMTQGQF